MDRVRRTGFTFVELLAVIIIISIILAITVPNILKVIKTSTKRTFEIDSQLVLQKIMALKLKDAKFDEASVSVETLSKYHLSAENYSDLRMGIVDGDTYIIIIGKNKWEGLKACGTINHIIAIEASDTESCKQIPASGYDYSKKVNRPALTTGMTPIKWTGSEWINTTEDDSEWYNYEDKKWANARTADGSMWVWVPRYVYKISSGWHSNLTGNIDVEFSKGVDDNWNSLVIGNVDIGTTASSSNNQWTNHPAFTFGGVELTGIWVAKYEPTANEGVANGYTSDGSCPIEGDNVTTKTVEIVPNVQSWRCIQIGNAFTVSRNMKNNSIYGWDTGSDYIDTHLMKNIEWGAVAYLSKSQYGKNSEEIYINNSQTYITGCSGNSVSSGPYNGCQNTYDSINGVKASTTGNVYGIYDLSGGALERVSAYISNGNDNLITYGSSIISGSNKYSDLYQNSLADTQSANYELSINKKGDAIYETSSNINGTYSWFGEYANMPSASGPWFVRGGYWGNGITAGVFIFGNTFGHSSSYNSFRPVLVVTE